MGGFLGTGVEGVPSCMGKFLEAMDMFTALIVVGVSPVCICVRTHHIVQFIQFIVPQ